MKKNINIIFEDEHFVVVNKPAGMLSVPDRMQSEISLKDILIEKYGSIFTVHRLDKETSGIILFAKDAHYIIEDFAKTNCSVIGLDWTIDPEKARREAPNKTLQGNLDPCVLYADKRTIKNETEKMLRAFGKQNYICNLGHGVYPDVDFEKAKYFIEVVKEFK